jgi:hypothetical protein
MRLSPPCLHIEQGLLDPPDGVTTGKAMISAEASG